MPVDAATIQTLLHSHRDHLEELHRHLHAHPELSHQEARTAARMAEEMRRVDGVEVHEQVGEGHGVAAILRNGEGPVVLLRADMDALPVQEVEKVPHRSTVDGVMHACGHDTHMTSLVGAVRLLAEMRDSWSGTLLAVFQPSEEDVSGARGMTEALKALVPHLDVALGQHVWPGHAGEVMTAPGPVMASVDGLNVTLHGRGGHGSQPHMTIDPVVLAAHIVVRLQTIVSRLVDPAQSAVVTVGSIQAGTLQNIIPPTAELKINVRAYDEDVRAQVKQAIERIVLAECDASGGATADFEWVTSAPATDNDPEATERVQQAFDAPFGERHVPLQPVSASEDFGLLADAYGAPYVFWMFGGFTSEPWPSNHAPTFIPDAQPTLDTGVQALVVGALAWLGRENPS